MERYLLFIAGTLIILLNKQFWQGQSFWYKEVFGINLEHRQLFFRVFSILIGSCFILISIFKN